MIVGLKKQLLRRIGMFVLLNQLPAPRPPKHKNSGTSSGAYFMPTVTRTNSDSGYAQPAHVVHQHVPSLRRRGSVSKFLLLPTHFL